MGITLIKKNTTPSEHLLRLLMSNYLLLTKEIAGRHDECPILRPVFKRNSICKLIIQTCIHEYDELMYLILNHTHNSNLCPLEISIAFISYSVRNALRPRI